MSDECDAVVRFDDDLYRVGKVKVADEKLLAIPSNESGWHTTYPCDGQVHETRPDAASSEYHRYQEPGPPLSDVTIQSFEDFEVSSSGPPRNAELLQGEPREQSLVVDSPSPGKSGRFFVAAVGNDHVDEVESLFGETTSATTHRVGTARGICWLLGWDPDGGITLDPST